MNRVRLPPLTRSIALAVIAAALAAVPAHAAAPSDWLQLEQHMIAPWPALQRSDGTFSDYVVAAAPHDPPRDPYGRAFLGLALLQAGIRGGNGNYVGKALKSIGLAARHPVQRDRIVFENLALATAYNLARKHLNRDSRFAAIRPALERRLERTRAVQFGGRKPYYNYYLVDSAALMELLSSGLRSNVHGSALAQRTRTRALITKLVNRQIERIAARYTSDDGAGRLAVLSDPPWNPPAYDAFSLALLGRIVGRLGPAASPQAYALMRGMARSLWVLASPQGSVSYYGRSQDQSWTLAMTAYGMLAAAHLPGTSAADATRFEALADRALVRLRDTYATGPFGFWITPAFASGSRPAAVRGLDHYADAASYTGLTLAGLDWSLDEMAAQAPKPGAIAADTPGVHRIRAGNGSLALVRTPATWFAVKQGPGTVVKGVGNYSADIRYDSGLVALESTSAGGKLVDVIPARPHQRRSDDRAEPQLIRGRSRARFIGQSLRTGANDTVTLSGGYRAGRRWLRRGVAIQYAPGGCGLTETLPTRAGDVVAQALWFRGNPATTADGRTLSDSAQRVTLSQAPARRTSHGGYASGTESGLTRVALRFRGTGRPVTFSFCPAESAQ